MEYNAKFNYVSSNMLRVSPLPVKDDDIFKIQIVSDHGKTNYLNISADQFKKIELVLFEGV